MFTISRLSLIYCLKLEPMHHRDSMHKHAGVVDTLAPSQCGPTANGDIMPQRHAQKPLTLLIRSRLADASQIFHVIYLQQE